MRHVTTTVARLLAGASSVAVLLLVVVWVRSHFVSDSFLYCTGPGRIGRSFWVQWGKGDIRLGAQNAFVWSGFEIRHGPPWDRRVWVDGNRIQFAILGLVLIRSRGYESAGSILVPCWMAILVSIGLAAASIRHACRRRLLADRARCANCGYDLRATPARCPECGMVVDAALAASVGGPAEAT